MATDKKIQMSQFNGTDYDDLFPRTKAELVIGTVNNSYKLEGYSYSQIFNNIIASGVKTAAGTYVGTGTAGQASPNRIVLPFAPKFGCVTNANKESTMMNLSWAFGSSTSIESGASINFGWTAGYVYILDSSNNFTWWADSQQNQLNEPGQTYAYAFFS